MLLQRLFMGCRIFTFKTLISHSFVDCFHMSIKCSWLCKCFLKIFTFDICLVTYYMHGIYGAREAFIHIFFNRINVVFNKLYVYLRTQTGFWMECCDLTIRGTEFNNLSRSSLPTSVSTVYMKFKRDLSCPCPTSVR